MPRPISINNSLAHGICNYRCRLCGLSSRAYDGPREFQSAAVTEALIRRVEEAARQGVHIRYIADAGDGEPTLHPELPARLALFGDMIRRWSAPVPVPEVSLVTNGSRLLQPGILDAVCDSGLQLIVSFPTPNPAHYGAVMLNRPDAGAELLQRVLPGISAAMSAQAAGRLRALTFHISPPERDIVRADFPQTVAHLVQLAREAGLSELSLVMFPATSNRTGLVDNQTDTIDEYRDLFRSWDGLLIDGVRLTMTRLSDRFFAGPGEIADFLYRFSMPCLWNASLFITASGDSTCSNDQAAHRAMGNLLYEDIPALMARKEAHMPDARCQRCDQHPARLRGSAAASLFRVAASMRMALARGS